MRSFRYVVLLTVLFSAAVAMAQAPPAPQRPNTPPDQVVVTVNGDPIYAGEVQMAAQRMAQGLAQSGQQVDPQQIGSAAMGQMVDGMLLVQEAKRRGYKVDPEIIKTSVEQAETSAGGAEQLDATLEQQGLNRARLNQLIEDSDLVNQLLTKLGEGIVVSDEQVSTFYTENPTYFKAPAEISARHILFKAEAGADDAAKAAAKAKAEAARTRALAGEDFATLAIELSEGPSAPKGGDLGFFSHDRMVPAFADAAFAMKVGGISDVVETRFGYHVIKVEERKEARTVPLDEVKDQIKQGLSQEEQQGMVEGLLTTLRETADIVPVGAEPAPAP